MRLNMELAIEESRVEAIKVEITNGTMSKGAGIRECFANGMDVREISKGLDIKYNHVYNVVKNEVLVNGLEVVETGRNNENSKKNQILKLLAEGKNITQVATEMRCLYNYVWQVAKGAGYTKKQQELIQPVVEAEPEVAPKASHKNSKKEVKTA